MLRFGVAGRDGKVSRVWRLVSLLAKPELYLVPDGFGRVMHTSYHPGGSWHLKVTMGGKVVHRSQIASNEIAPGYAHLFSIRVTPRSIFRDNDEEEGVVWLDAPSTGRWTLIELVHEAHGAPSDRWVGKSTGSILVGRMPVADGTTIAVISHEEDAPEEWIQSNMPRPDDDAIARMQAVPPENLRALLHGVTNEGVTWVTDGLEVVLNLPGRYAGDR